MKRRNRPGERIRAANSLECEDVEGTSPASIVNSDVALAHGGGEGDRVLDHARARRQCPATVGVPMRNAVTTHERQRLAG